MANGERQANEKKRATMRAEYAPPISAKRPPLADPNMARREARLDVPGLAGMGLILAAVGFLFPLVSGAIRTNNWVFVVVRSPFDTPWGPATISSTTVLFLFVAGILTVLLRRSRPVKAALQAYRAPAKVRVVAIISMMAALYLGFACLLVLIRAPYEELLLIALGMLYSVFVIFAASFFFFKGAPQTGAKINDR